ncbi:lipase (class 2) domain-containing protein [Ditylenchus destructor]|uniref:Lipase (Class 2) domain-containing protein n=1 Tax=Ditylenchus destructor TaxID=166010 RepID=A0AAD4MRT2_9BILA|nr:lipase (class 2) domain-containing protein [Ditylenchus destructor]
MNITFLTTFSIIFLMLFGSVAATFSENFQQFLTNFYGIITERQLSRKDLGSGGSWGGGDQSFVPGNVTRRRPVVFVNGLSTIAQDYAGNRDYFLQHGYSNAELYATTYGSGAETMMTDSITCEHVRAERNLIEAVSAYTNSQVDVIGYSMGSPTSRKAILGGFCVDTGEFIGGPITHLVHTFLAVAGANFGAEILCKDSEPTPILDACNSLNGIVCNSTFLNDINSFHGYEGSVIYTMYSKVDEVTGYRTCNDQVLTSAIPGEALAVQYNETDGMGHFGMLYVTVNKQFELISKGQL